MRKLLLAGAAFGAFGCIAGPALASNFASNGIAISGTSPDTCTLDSGTQNSASNATYTGGAGSSTLAIGALASSTDASLQATSAEITFVGMCNYAHTVSISSANSGLVNTSSSNDPIAGSGLFIQKVGYNATYTWAGADTSRAGLNLSNSSSPSHGTGTSTNGATVSVGGANQGNLVLDFAIPASATPVVAGTYNDTLTITLGGVE